MKKFTKEQKKKVVRLGAQFALCWAVFCVFIYYVLHGSLAACCFTVLPTMAMAILSDRIEKVINGKEDGEGQGDERDSRMNGSGN